MAEATAVTTGNTAPKSVLAKLALAGRQFLERLKGKGEAVDDHASARELAASLDTLYGLETPDPVDGWIDQCVDFALACGAQPERALWFAETVVEALMASLATNHLTARTNARQAAAELVSETVNRTLPRRKFAEQQHREAFPDETYLGPGGTHLKDDPVAPSPPVTHAAPSHPASVTLTRGDVKALIGMAPDRAQGRLETLLAQQLSEHGRHAATPIEGDHQPAGTVLHLVVPPSVITAITDPKRADAALSLHAAHDRLRERERDIKTAGVPLHLIDATIEAGSLLDPALALTALTDVVHAADKRWAQPPQLLDALKTFPHGIGSGISDGAAQALHTVLGEQQLQGDLISLAQLLPPEPLALIVACLALGSWGLRAQAILGDGIIRAAAQVPEPDPGEDEVDAALAAGVSFGYVQLLRCLRWAAMLLPAILFRYPDPGELPVEIRFPDLPSAQALCAVLDFPVPVRHTGAVPTIEVPLAVLGEHAAYEHTTAQHARAGRQVRYDNAGVHTDETGRAVVGEPLAAAHLAEAWPHGPGQEPSVHRTTQAERNAVAFLRQHGSGVVSSGAGDRDPLTILAAALGDILAEPGSHAAVIVPAIGRFAVELQARLHVPVLTLDDQADLRAIRLAAVTVFSYDYAAQRDEVLRALHPTALVLVSPPLGTDTIPASLHTLLSLSAPHRIAIVAPEVAQQPVQLEPLVTWAGGSTLPRSVWDGIRHGAGSGTGAAQRGERAVLARQDRTTFHAPDARRPVRYVQMAVPHGTIFGHETTGIGGAFATIRTHLAKLPSPLGGKAEHDAQQQQQLRAAGEGLRHQELHQGDRGRVQVCLKQLRQRRGKTVVVADEFQTDLITRALPDSTTDDGAFRAGRARILLVTAPRLAGLDWSEVRSCHVLSRPTQVAKAMPPHGRGGVLELVGYPLTDVPGERGGWDTLRLAATRDDEPVQKSRYQSNTNYKGDAATFDDLVHMTERQRLRSWDAKGRYRPQDVSDIPSNWGVFFSQHPQFAPVRDQLVDGPHFVEAHRDPTRYGAGMSRELGLPPEWDPLELALDGERTLPFAGHDGTPVQLPLQAFFKPGESARLTAGVDAHTLNPQQLRLKQAGGDNDPHVLQPSYMGAHVRGVKSLLADPDLVWEQPNADGTRRRLYLKRFGLTGTHGAGSVQLRPTAAELAANKKLDRNASVENMRYHHLVGDFRDSPAGLVPAGEIHYADNLSSHDLRTTLEHTAHALRPFHEPIHQATRQLLQPQAATAGASRR